MTPLQPVDVVLAVVILIPALWGLWHGLISGASGPLALAFAAFAALGVGPEVGRLWFSELDHANLLGAGLTFLLAWLWVRLLGALLGRVARIAQLGWADHLGGLVAGALAGALAGAWLLLSAAHFLPGEEGHWEDSRLLPTCAAILAVFSSEEVVTDTVLTAEPFEG
ncbi:MAG: CvpA family protein [Deltaproteobacteria bacterium]|nr:CvpA family protein [Deltaproteobacteria bacterium]